jgi:membrane-bound ClpP family serine protease
MFFDIAVVVFLMGLAITLILVEIFLLPGITLAGVGGFLFAAGGVICAYDLGVTAGHVTLITSVLLFGAAFFSLLRAKSFGRVALHTDIDSHIPSARDLGIRPGDSGITLSRLAPLGKAKINDLTVEAASTGDFIDEGTPVTVLRVESHNIIVTPKQSNNNVPNINN